MELEYFFTDSGFCRVVYRTTDKKKVYCLQAYNTARGETNGDTIDDITDLIVDLLHALEPDIPPQPVLINAAEHYRAEKRGDING
jgi:hypothetical protein